MKKKLLCAGMMVVMMSALSGCGQKNAEAADAVNPDDYVTLGDYKNIEVTAINYDFTEDELKAYIDKDLEYYVSSYDLYDYKPIKDKETVSENDVVNIDYVGKKDGVAFAGGTAEGAHLKIGSGSFIPGFEDGLIGVAVGDTVDLNLTFPDTYDNEELKGQEVVFTVSVNSVDEALAPEYDEDFFANFGIEGVSTYDDYLEYARGYLNEAKDEQNVGAVEEEIWTAVTDMCEVKEIPQVILDEKNKELDEDLQEYAEYYGVDTDTMIQYMGHDQESYEAQKKTAAEAEAKKTLICMAIAKKENIDITDEDLKQIAQEEYEDYGYASAAEMLESKSNEYIRSYVRYKKVMEVLKGYAKVNEGETVSMLAEYLE